MAPSGFEKIDLPLAQRMLDDGATVRGIAEHFGTSTQAVYAHIRAGRLHQPA